MTVSALSIVTGGMHRAAERFQASASRAARFGTGLGEDVDLATEMVEVLSAETNFKASAKMIRALDDMTGTLLDILA